MCTDNVYPPPSPPVLPFTYTKTNTLCPVYWKWIMCKSLCEIIRLRIKWLKAFQHIFLFAASGVCHVLYCFFFFSSRRYFKREKVWVEAACLCGSTEFTSLFFLSFHFFRVDISRIDYNNNKCARIHTILHVNVVVAARTKCSPCWHNRVVGIECYR